EGGGFNLSGTASLTGAGVLLYNAPASASDLLSLTANAAVTLSPLTSGPYQGLGAWHDRAPAHPGALPPDGKPTSTPPHYSADAHLYATTTGINNFATRVIIDTAKFNTPGPYTGTDQLNLGPSTTKFYVADAGAHQTYLYDASGASQTSASLVAANPRGIAS